MTLSYIHRFEEGADPSAPPLLLLHGTGGNENDLLPLGRIAAPGSALLSPRGKILENGMPRFFRRFGEGSFDEDDVRRRAGELADFVQEARTEYSISSPIALGYSNGANVAAAVLLLWPEALSGAILLRAMPPLSHSHSADLNGKPVMIASGAYDPLMTPGKAAQLVSLLRRDGAIVAHHKLPVGHELSQADVTLARNWMQALSKTVPRIGTKERRSS